MKTTTTKPAPLPSVWGGNSTPTDSEHATDGYSLYRRDRCAKDPYASFTRAALRTHDDATVGRTFEKLQLGAERYTYAQLCEAVVPLKRSGFAVGRAVRLGKPGSGLLWNLDRVRQLAYFAGKAAAYGVTEHCGGFMLVAVGADGRPIGALMSLRD